MGSTCHFDVLVFSNLQFKRPEYRGRAVGRYVRTSHFCAACLGGLCQMLADSGRQSSVKSGSMWIAAGGIREIWSASFCGNIHVCTCSFFRPIGRNSSRANLARLRAEGRPIGGTPDDTCASVEPFTRGILKRFVALDISVRDHLNFCGECLPVAWQRCAGKEKP